MKTKNITPIELYCAVGGCPTLYQTDRDTLIIVGRQLTSKEKKTLLGDHIGKNETAVEIPVSLVSNLRHR